ncbi:DNA binding protein [Alteromonas phage vB_AcoS-R7M]|uniref:DNA binding protein n=1 Tax=Alteromonas phage vB_AcoS-R7M TaxID=2729541 RepID=A0A6M3YRB9_9CAUD|nr:DNA binding protein [Alteromonas phage vB_AcoS-R7M]QJI53384.1 DNA binding protein [Alteromonas phage vB_AcoS-R7M]
MPSINEQSVVTSDEIMGMLTNWYNAKEQLDMWKTREAELRKAVFEKAFSDPKEGTNTLTLPEGYALKAQHVINRKVDDASFRSLTVKLAELGVDVEKLVKYKPELSKSVYNKLNDKQLALMNECVIATPGTPQLSVTKPKKG